MLSTRLSLSPSACRTIAKSHDSPLAATAKPQPVSGGLCGLWPFRPITHQLVIDGIDKRLKGGINNIG